MWSVRTQGGHILSLTSNNNLNEYLYENAKEPSSVLVNNRKQKNLSSHGLYRAIFLIDFRRNILGNLFYFQNIGNFFHRQFALLSKTYEQK